MAVQRTPVAVDSAVHIINGLLTPATNHTWAEPICIVVVLLIVLVVGAVVNPAAFDLGAFGKLTSDLKKLIDGASDIINKHFTYGRDSGVINKAYVCVATGNFFKPQLKI